MRIFYLRKASSLAVLFCLLSGTGCSIKEDRAPCPSCLNVSFRDRDRITSKVHLLGQGTEERFGEEIDISAYDPYWTRPVRKGTIDLSAWTGADAEDLRIVLPEDRECDSLYAFHTRVDATRDMAYAEVVLHKQFCTVFLDLAKTGAQMQDYRFLVEGTTCGIDLKDLTPVQGACRFTPGPADPTGVLTFRIPRQSDDALSISLWQQHGDDTPTEAAGQLPLGKYIAQQGYDWRAEDLQDIYVAIDLTLNHAAISVGGWEDGIVFTIIEL